MSLNKSLSIPKIGKPIPLEEYNKDQKQEWENTKKAYIIDDFIEDLTKVA